jgi:hypothetical protein
MRTAQDEIFVKRLKILARLTARPGLQTSPLLRNTTA